MKQISIGTPFTFIHDDHSKQHFGVGTHEVDDTLADHWYVKAHIGDAPATTAQSLSDDERAELEQLRADKLAREQADAEKAKAEQEAKDKADADAKQKADAEKAKAGK